jgi:hypothetical protein
MGDVSGAPPIAELGPVGRHAGNVCATRRDRHSRAAVVLGVTRPWGLSSWAFLGLGHGAGRQRHTPP